MAPVILSADDVLDNVLAMSSGAVRAQVDRLRRRYPGASPEQIVDVLERHYLRWVSTSGGAVGAAAAMPVLGTGTAMALTAGQVAAFLGASGTFVLAVADVHGVEIDDVERRKALLLGSLLGERGAEVLEAELGVVGTARWGRTLATRLPVATVKTVNTMLSRRLVRTGTAQIGGVALGRLAPFGIGAVIGWTGGRALGKTVVAGSRTAFGSAPDAFVRPVGLRGGGDLSETAVVLVAEDDEDGSEHRRTRKLLGRRGSRAEAG